MRVAADAAHLVAIDADGSRALVVAGGALADVAPRGDAVELRRAGPRPALRVRIAHVVAAAGQVLLAMTIRAEAGAVAAPAGAGIGLRLDAVAAEKVVA